MLKDTLKNLMIHFLLVFLLRGYPKKFALSTSSTITPRVDAFVPLCVFTRSQRKAQSDNHHGVRNTHPSIRDKGSNQSSPVAILSNTSPPTSAVSFGLGGDVFVAQHGHNTNSIT